MPIKPGVRRRIHRALLLGATTTTILAAAGPATAATACPGIDALPTTVSVAADEPQRAVTCLVNAERTARGLPALTRHAALDTASRAHSDWMGRTGTFDHYEEPGSAAYDPDQRARLAGFAGIGVVENIAGGQSTPRQVVSNWMASASHCRNILSPQHAHVGVGLTLTSSGPYVPLWTQVFGRLSDPAPSSDSAPAATCPPPKGGDGTADAPDATRKPTPTPLTAATPSAEPAALAVAPAPAEQSATAATSPQPSAAVITGTSGATFALGAPSRSLPRRARITGVQLQRLTAILNATLPRAGRASVRVTVSGRKAGRRMSVRRTARFEQLPAGRGTVRLLLPARAAGIRGARVAVKITANGRSASASRPVGSVHP